MSEETIDRQIFMTEFIMAHGISSNFCWLGTLSAYHVSQSYSCERTSEILFLIFLFSYFIFVCTCLNIVLEFFNIQVLLLQYVNFFIAYINIFKTQTTCVIYDTLMVQCILMTVRRHNHTDSVFLWYIHVFLCFFL